MGDGAVTVPRHGRHRGDARRDTARPLCGFAMFIRPAVCILMNMLLFFSMGTGDENKSSCIQYYSKITIRDSYYCAVTLKRPI